MTESIKYCICTPLSWKPQTCGLFIYWDLPAGFPRSVLHATSIASYIGADLLPLDLSQEGIILLNVAPLQNPELVVQ